MEQLAPVPLFGGVGDRGAERFPDFIPWDAGVGEAVVFGVGVGPLGFAVGAETSNVRRGKVFRDVADVEVGEACDAVVGGVGGPSVRAREGLGDWASEAYVDSLWLGVVFIVVSEITSAQNQRAPSSATPSAASTTPSPRSTSSKSSSRPPSSSTRPSSASAQPSSATPKPSESYTSSGATRRSGSSSPPRNRATASRPSSSSRKRSTISSSPPPSSERSVTPKRL